MTSNYASVGIPIDFRNAVVNISKRTMILNGQLWEDTMCSQEQDDGTEWIELYNTEDTDDTAQLWYDYTTQKITKICFSRAYTTKQGYSEWFHYDDTENPDIRVEGTLTFVEAAHKKFAEGTIDNEEFQRQLNMVF